MRRRSNLRNKVNIINYNNTDMNTQYINRVELQGRVGTVRITSIHDTVVANFSVMTEHHYETSEGHKIVETTWTCVAAFEGENVNTKSLTRGSIVHLVGRLRTNKYIDASGCERVFTEVVASSLKVLA